jgi:DNA-binding CsgD family transcriptional regulator
MDGELLDCTHGKIFVLTNDMYFFFGFKFIICSMMPELLAKTGVVYDVEYIGAQVSPNELIEGGNSHYHYVIDLNLHMKFKSNIAKFILTCTAKKKSLIVFESINQPLKCINCFYKSMPINILKDQLVNIISGKVSPTFTSFYRHGLTRREGLIIHYVLMGESMQSIARILGVNSKTAYTLRSNAYKKFGVRTIQELFYNASIINFTQ